MTLHELTDLARELESSNPYDRSAQRGSLQRLLELQEQARRGNAPNLATCLGAVSRLIEALTEGGEFIGREQVQGIACLMLDSLGGAPGAAAPEEDEAIADEEAPAQPEEPEEEDEDEEPAAAMEEPVAKDALSEEPPAAPAPAASGEPLRLKRKADMVLGRMLVELKHVTRAQVAAALRFHRAKGPRIGECLLLQGAISPQHLLNVLKIQDLLRATPEGITPETLARHGKTETPETPKADPDRPVPKPRTVPQRVTEGIFLGEVLLGAEMITNDQLEKALHLHHHTGIRVGEALVELGALSEEDVESGVELQKQLRRIAGLKVV